MKYEQIKNILITTGYTQQHDKDEVLDYINEIQQENKQLKDNWNKLKEIVKSQSDFKLKIRNKELWFEADELLSKMQELDGSNDILKEAE